MNLKKNPLYRKHFPNNLKYLDDTSQTLIRTLNNHPVPLRDKLLTVLVYRVVGDKRLLDAMQTRMVSIPLKELEKLATALNKDSLRLLNRYSTHYPEKVLLVLVEENFYLLFLVTFWISYQNNFYKWKDF